MFKTLNIYRKELQTAFQKHDLTLLAAAQAYYYLLSVVPLLFICFAVIPYFHIDPQDALDFIGSLLPGEIASIFEEQIVDIVAKPKGGLLTVGIVGALWTASNGVNAFIRSSNSAYDIEESRGFIRVRLTALILTISMIFAFILAILLPIAGTIFVNIVEDNFSAIANSAWFDIGFELIRISVTIIVLTLILFTLYRFAPAKRLPIRHLLPGAITATLLWQIITFLFSFYVSNFGNYSTTYGSLGGLIILMIWFFLTGLIFMLGIEINAIYHRRQIKSITIK